MSFCQADIASLENFQAQRLTELSRLPSLYLSLPGYPIRSGQASESDLFLVYKGLRGPKRSGLENGPFRRGLHPRKAQFVTLAA
jgi:hypothetical protein